MRVVERTEHRLHLPRLWVEGRPGGLVIPRAAGPAEQAEAWNHELCACVVSAAGVAVVKRARPFLRATAPGIGSCRLGSRSGRPRSWRCVKRWPKAQRCTAQAPRRRPGAAWRVRCQVPRPTRPRARRARAGVVRAPTPTDPRFGFQLIDFSAQEKSTNQPGRGLI